jgi:membrane protease YdiL (CAAX protease family)
VLFLICGLAIFVFGSGYYTAFRTNHNLVYLASLSVFFLFTAGLLKRLKRLEKYWQVAFAFFVACCALLFSTFMARFTDKALGVLNLTTSTPQGIALAKLYEMVMIIVPIVVLTKLSGMDLGSIYLKRGNLKSSLGIGTLVLFNFATSALLFFAARYTDVDRLGQVVLWSLVFSFANSFMEELWLRGIFLKRFQPLLGFGGTVFLSSVIFSLMHVGAVYLTPAAIPFLLMYAFTLGLACGYMMMKTDNIWGGTLIHAAADLLGFVAIMANV